MEKLTIHDIPKEKFEGYIWYSDTSRPRVFIGDEEVTVEERSDAFIIEGLLWNPKKRTSYNIYFHDGQQHVCKYDVTTAALEGKEDVTTEDYVTHRIPGVARLSFVRYWLPEKDEMCEDFEVLVPGQLVFVGFNNMK